MLKFPILDEDSKQSLSAKYIFASDLEAVDGAELIPIDYGGRLITSLSPSISVNELGKQLLTAAAEGNVAETKMLLNKGALFTADWLGTSPLHLAARNNHLEVVEILLKAGISRDARTKVDKTSLHMAATEGHLSVVETLLEYGSDPDCRDLLGMTPLHWAAQNGHAEVVKVLVQHYAQTDPVNKFDLTPAAIAAQINRQDIVDLINGDLNEPSAAAHHLALELMEGEGGVVMQDAETLEHTSVSNSPIPLETILMEDAENSIDPESLHLNRPTAESDNTSESQDASFAESIRLLQEHGITMLPNEDNNILTTVMEETGHSVVLTDAGKQVLNAFKESEEKPSSASINRKIITVTPEEFLSMTANCITSKSNNVLKQINRRLVPKNVKRIVMKKNKLVPVSAVNNVYKLGGLNGGNDMETVMGQLIEARKIIEEYKIKLHKKEQEAERYKRQLTLLMNTS